MLHAHKTVLGEDDIGRAITRIAHEIVEKTKADPQILILGIPTRGVFLAQRLARKISSIIGTDVPSGALDTTMYRDDLADHPTRTVHPTDIPTPIDGQTVILVDDVLYTGRTIKAALDALFDLGRPGAVRLAVLVDRGHRELPIRPDFIGKNLPTSRSETVTIELRDVDSNERVIIEEAP